VDATFGSLFAGIGGLDLGLERAGWKCRWQVEIDEFCLKVLRKRWPNVPKFKDVRQIKEGQLEYVDLIAGGFPCQPVSVAGKRKGKQDERWLWPEFARIIRMVRPRFVLVENVPGILSVNGGEAFAEVLGDLAKSGYDAEWNMLSAAMFGAPHLRNRIFLVAWDTYGRGNGGCHEGQVREVSQGANSEPDRICKNVADPDSRTKKRIPQKQRASISKSQWSRSTIFGATSAISTDWAVEPSVGRVAHGVPARVDRLRCLGNAVIPQVAEWIGKMILEAFR